LDKKHGIKEKWHSFIEWCKDIGGLIKENRNITIAIVIFVALVIVAIVISTTLGAKSPSTEAVAVAETTAAASTEEETTLTVPDEPLQENAIVEVNELLKNIIRQWQTVIWTLFYPLLRDWMRRNRLRL